MGRKQPVFRNPLPSLVRRCLRFVFIAILGLMLSLVIHKIEVSHATSPISTTVSAYKNYDTSDRNFSQGDRLLLISQDLFLPQIKQADDSWKNSARRLNREGVQFLEMGNAEAALKHWEEAEAIYEENGNREGVIGSRINQAHAWEAMGHYRKACDRLLQTFVTDKKCDELNRDNLSEVLEGFPKINENLTFLGMQTLGEVLRRVGKLDESLQVLEESLKNVRSPDDKSKALLSLGNTARSLVNKHEDLQNETELSLWLKEAFRHYENAINVSGSLTTRIQARLNYINLAKRYTNSSKSIDTLIKEVKADINKLPLSQLAIDARIHLACSFLGCDRPSEATPKNVNSELSNIEIEQLLTTAIDCAEQLQSPRLKSLAVGTLGRLYEWAGNKLEAERSTGKALNLSLANNFLDIAYQWQCQMGRLLRDKGDEEGAISYYRAAVKTLDHVRRDLSIINDLEFGFRTSVEPVYRQLAELLISASPSSQNSQKESRLKEAIIAIDSLQIAEIEFFFNCNLSDNTSRSTKPIAQIFAEIEEIGDRAVFIYPILLSNRLEIIFKLPQQPWEHRTKLVNLDEVERTIQRLQSDLRVPDLTEEVQEDAHKMFGWFIAPIQPELEKLKNSDGPTLVFGLDDELQNVSMAVLYNEGKYLVEHYPIAVISSLQLFNPKPRQQQLQVLTAGVQKPQEVEGRNFKELQYVQQELTEIRKQTKSPLSPLLNQRFTDKELEQLISSTGFPIIHIATHGNFSSNPEETFILAWGKLIKAKDFKEILQTIDLDNKKALELLVLSACETARGNPRAALGLAGIAAQARVRSTLATLWQVDDQATSDIMVEFYRQLGDEKTIAESLRKAQLALLDKNATSPPYFWAAYILIGNWI